MFDNDVGYCVIGAALAKQYAQHFIDPMGKQIRIGSRELTIIGIAKPCKPNLFLFINMDHSVIVPYSTAFMMQSSLQLHNILFHLVKHPNISLVQEQLANEMKRLLPNKTGSIPQP